MSDLNMVVAEDSAPETMRTIEIITEEILFYKRQAGSAIIEIGRRLNEAKEQLEHGEWLPWLQEKVEFSERSAQDFMRLAKEYGKSAEIADLGRSKALALLALPESEREDFVAEKHEVNGEEKSVAEMTNAELKQAIKERDEARRQLEEERAAGEGSAIRVSELEDSLERAGAELAAAEKDKAKMAEDMKFLNERLAGLTDEVAEKERALEEMRSKPVDVAVQYQTDPAELEKAKKEGADAATEELDKVKEALQKAKEKETEAKKQLEALQERAKLADRAAEQARQDVERARKEAQLAGDKDLAAFTVLFEQEQEGVNKMVGLLKKMELSGRKETADKLRGALGQLAELIRKAASKQ